MPWAPDGPPNANPERSDRVASRSRNEGWRKPPRRIESSECIGCDTCVRNCPPEFGAIFDRGLDVIIIPELCSGCPVCVMVCPVDCIYVDEEWAQTDNDMWNHVALTADVAVDGDDRAKRRVPPGRPDQGPPGPPPTP